MPRFLEFRTISKTFIRYALASLGSMMSRDTAHGSWLMTHSGVYDVLGVEFLGQGVGTGVLDHLVHHGLSLFRRKGSVYLDYKV